MSGQIIEESRFLLCCFVSGIIITAVYDLFRIFRRIVRHGMFLIALEDLFFWLTAAVFLFIMLYMTNNGVIRWFSVAGAGAGMLLYKCTVGEHLVHIMSTLIQKLQNLVSSCLGFLFRPIKRLIKRMFGRMRRGFKKIKKLIKKKLTGNIKKVNIVLCKHKNEKVSLKNRETTGSYHERETTKKKGRVPH